MFIQIFKWLTLCNHPLILLIHLAPLRNAISRLKQLLCLVSPVSPSNVCHQHLYQHIQIQVADTSCGSYPRVALVTVIQGCAVATIRGRLLCEPRLLTSQIRYLFRNIIMFICTTEMNTATFYCCLNVLLVVL